MARVVKIGIIEGGHAAVHIAVPQSPMQTREKSNG